MTVQREDAAHGSVQIERTPTCWRAVHVSEAAPTRITLAAGSDLDGVTARIGLELSAAA